MEESSSVVAEDSPSVVAEDSPPADRVIYHWSTPMGNWCATGATLGWRQCYWCGWWQEDMIIIDWIGAPLCDWCFDWHIVGGRPYRPDARDRMEASINANRILPQSLPRGLTGSVASFLVADWEP